MSSLITCPFQVLCEGDGDEGFLKALGAAHSLPSFNIRKVSSEGNFKATLKGLNLFVERGEVTRVLLVADNDLDPQSSFQKLQTAIRQCGKYPVPKEPMKIRGGSVKTAVLMLPGTGTVGNLETLLLRGVAAKAPELLACTQEFVRCTTGASDDWPKGQRDKMLLTSVVAASVKSNPGCSLSYLWNKDGCPIDISCDDFKWIADFLRDFFRE